MLNTKNGWTIRRTTPDDLPVLLAMFDEAVAWLNARGIEKQWGTTPVSTRPHLVAEIQEFLEYGVVAEREGIEGFIAVSLTVPEDLAMRLGTEAATTGGYVHSLVARRTPSVRGAGAALLRWADRHASEHGKDRLYLTLWEDNPGLVAYYERMGFVKLKGVRGGLFEKQVTG